MAAGALLIIPTGTQDTRTTRHTPTHTYTHTYIIIGIDTQLMGLERFRSLGRHNSSQLMFLAFLLELWSCVVIPRDVRARAAAVAFHIRCLCPVNRTH